MPAVPVFPAVSVYDVATEQVFESSSVSAEGVKVPAHVMLSPDVMAASVPLGHVTSSSLTNPATASVKTIVRVDVSPVFRAVSLIDMLLTEGARVSTA